METEQFEFLLSDYARSFVLTHEKDDLNKLLLNPPSDSEKNIRWLVEQIQSRRKAQGKLPQWYGNADLIYPPPLSLEQASSETTAAYKSQLVGGPRLVDLTGGMGIDCLQMSEKFEETEYVERNEALCELMQHNSKALDKNIRIHHLEAADFLKSCPARAFAATTFFIDPARRNLNKDKVVLLEDCEPDVTKIIPQLLAAGARVLLKTSPMLDISSVTNGMTDVSEVHIVAVKNEVKELLFCFNPGTAEDPLIKAVNLKTAHPAFSFHRREEEQTQLRVLSDGNTLGRYLYEPNAAILKAGAFKIITARYQLEKLAAHTHLYTSDKKIDGFPGRTFEIFSVLDKKAMKQLSQTPVHVISRNHPLKVAAIRSRYKLKEGGSEFVIAVRVGTQPCFLKARLID